MKKNKISSFFKTVFRSKVNVLSSFLTFFISFFSVLSLSLMSQINIAKNPGPYEFDRNYIIYQVNDNKNYQNEINTTFPTLKSSPFKYASISIDDNYADQTNLPTDSNIEVRVFGVMPNFQGMPIVSTSTPTSFMSKTKIVHGRSFTNQDFNLSTNGFITYSSILNKLNYSNDTGLYIGGIKLNLIGILEDTNDLKRTINDNYIPIYIPITSFNNIVPSNLFFTQTLAIINIEGYNPDSFKAEGIIVSKTNYSSIFENNDINNNSIYLLFFAIFAFIAVLASIILQFIYVKNSYYDIGIRRAVGCNKSGIVFMLSSRSIFANFLGFFIGISFAYLLLLSTASVFSAFSMINCFVFEFNITYLTLATFALFLSVGVLIPALYGANINISTILTEER